MNTPSGSNARAALAGVAMLAAGTAGLGCTNSAKISEEKAAAHVERLAKLADEDVQEVRRGLPRGAQTLGAAWAGTGSSGNPPQGNRPSVCRKLEQARSGNRDLMVAKSTVFALADTQGVVLCSDQDPDALAGKALLPAFPQLRKALEGAPAEAVGAMAELAAKPNLADQQWLVAVPVRDSSDAVRGIYVSGWSYKRFAYHLEETLKHDITIEAIQAKKERFKQPLLYAFVFAGPRVYGAPVTPQINAEALEKLDLPARTTNGLHHQPLEITGRAFGLAAVRVAALGGDAGVAILRSEL